jgi:hypothetical protein
MRTLSFAVVIATMATALHADPIDDFLRSLELVSGPRDGTVLIRSDPLEYVQSECERSELLRRLRRPYRYWLREPEANQACAAEIERARERALRALGLEFDPAPD